MGTVMHIVVKNFGGLGNQLFQYAAGRFLAKRYGASLQIAPALPRLLQSFGHPRPMLLSKFAIAARVKPLTYYDRLVSTRRPELAAAARLLRARGAIQVIRQAPERCLFHQELRIAEGVGTAYIVGYWQDYSIVREVEPELRGELSLRERLQGMNLHVAQQICQAHNPVSVHLRRGDYASFFGTNMQLPITYYESAISRMLRQNRRSTFFVFSDDAAFARQWARGDRRLIIVDHNDALSAHEDLRLMSMCRHHIIANSTFSWWAAWLDPRSDKQVIAPATWLGYETTRTAIAAPEWTLLAA